MDIAVSIIMSVGSIVILQDRTELKINFSLAILDLTITTYCVTLVSDKVSVFLNDVTFVIGQVAQSTALRTPFLDPEFETGAGHHVLQSDSIEPVFNLIGGSHMRPTCSGNYESKVHYYESVKINF